MTMRIEHLEFSYGSRKVLRDVDLEISDGDFVSILGPNGVGKTTLLRCICRSHSPKEGRISIDGRDLNDFPSRELAKEISYVPQRSVPSLTTVYDSILIGRKPHVEWSLTKRDIDMVWNVMKLFRMQDYALKYTDEISGGELQKVQIARAVVQDAKVMVLDEPTNNLDIANQHNIMHLLTQLVEKRGITVVMTMHDINIALRYSSKFIFVKDGEVLAYGGMEVVTPEVIKQTFGIDVVMANVDGVRTVVPCHDQESFLDLDFDELLPGSGRDVKDAPDGSERTGAVRTSRERCHGELKTPRGNRNPRERPDAVKPFEA